jgi:hypothetical protein
MAAPRARLPEPGYALLFTALAAIPRRPGNDGRDTLSRGIWHRSCSLVNCRIDGMRERPGKVLAQPLQGSRWPFHREMAQALHKGGGRIYCGGRSLPHRALTAGAAD